MSAFFSVIIPVYNMEEYIDECVMSVLNQTYTSFEIIIIDDGSSDSSRTKCYQYEKSYPDKITVLHQKNTGALFARINGIQKAKGNFCIFIDSDDTIQPCCLRCLSEIIEGENDVDIILYNHNLQIENKRRLLKAEPLFEKDLCSIGKLDVYKNILYSVNMNSLCFKAIRTILLKDDNTDYRAFQNRIYGEDLLQSLYAITQAKKIRYCAEPLYNYRIRSSSVSHRVKLSLAETRYNRPLLDLLFYYMDIWGLKSKEMLEQYYVRCLKELSWTFSECYFSSKKMEEKRGCLRFNWGSLPNPSALLHRKSHYLNPVHKTRLHFLLNKKFHCLILFETMCNVVKMVRNTVCLLILPLISGVKLVQSWLLGVK